MKNIIENLNKKEKTLFNINDSHDVVAYLMILMNKNVANFLKQNNTGIFRWCKLKDETQIQNIYNLSFNVSIEFTL